MVTPQVVGVRETLATLRQIDPALRRETVRNIRRAAQPLQRAAQQLAPAQPLSGWTRGRYAYNQASVQRGVKIQVGGRARRDRSTWPLVTMQQTDAGGAVYDMAGRRSIGNSLQGQAFIAGLNRFASPSRKMWPAAEQNLEPVQREVMSAIERASQQINRQLLVR